MQFRDIELAEDALQDALASALSTWPQKNIPNNPEGWLYQVAKRKAIDRLRKVTTRREKADSLTYHTELASMDELDIPEQSTISNDIPDERLRLIFTCCHPALPTSVHTALTLKTVCGLSTAQIASAYLVSETSMAQRIVRAKRKIKVAGIPFVVPGKDLWPERWKSVLAVVYLIFNEGYSNVNTSVDLCDEAIYLVRILVKLLPHEPEAAGLLCLMLLGHSRRSARIKNHDKFTPLCDQNRDLWDKSMIAEAQNLLVKALSKGGLGPYQLQAAISAVHCQAACFEDTDWLEITQLYERLHIFEPTPVVMLNASVALSFAKSPAAGLASLQLITQGGNLDTYQPYHAAHADMLKRNGQTGQAKMAYQKAIALSICALEKKYLQQQLAELLNTPPH